MIVLYAAISSILALIAAFWLARFPIDRAQHERRLDALDRAARTDIDASLTPP